ARGGQGGRRGLVAALLLHHAAAAAADARAGARVLGRGLAARVRPVLHHDRGRPVQLDADGRVLDLPHLVRQLPPRLRRGDVDPHDAGAGRGQRRAAAAGPALGGHGLVPLRAALPRAGWWAVSLAFGALFIFPLYLTVMQSLKTSAEAAASPPTL